MFNAFLLIVFSIFVIITGIQLFKWNVIFGGAYFFLFIYSIFAQIGYCFFPELSELSKAYFGQKYFYIFYAFNFLSFISFYFLCKISNLKKERTPKFKVIQGESKNNYYLFVFFVLFFCLFMLTYFIGNYNTINYANAGDENFINSQGALYRVFTMSFKFMSPLCLILYVQWRSKSTNRSFSRFKKSTTLFFLITFLSMFVIFANKLGSRTDILAFGLGVLVFEYSLGFDLKKVLAVLMCGLMFTVFLLYLENSRTESSYEYSSSFEAFLMKDYYAPAHMLYTALAYDYVKPLEVIASNFCNSLFLMNHPYLQAPITDLINPNVATRSAGYAFYLFTEGYIFMGYLGFIYNALMLFCGLKIFQFLASSDNKYFNHIIIAIICSQFANIARSQSSYFIKDIYMLFIPVYIMIFLSTGFRPKFTYKKGIQLNENL